MASDLFCEIAHCVADARMCAAAADIGDRLGELVIARARIALPHRADGHDHASLAVAALRHLVIDPGLLHWRQTACAQALDGPDVLADHRADGRDAAALRIAV